MSFDVTLILGPDPKQSSSGADVINTAVLPTDQVFAVLFVLANVLQKLGIRE